MYSSSSVPKFLEHSNGRLYYIGIITAENANGNGPRWPLCIAEVDREKCCVILSTVTVIDTEREYHRCQKETAVKQLSSVDYSNHGVYEDRKGRIIVYAPFRRNLERWENVLNRYVIEL